MPEYNPELVACDVAKAGVVLRESLYLFAATVSESWIFRKVCKYWRRLNMLLVRSNGFFGKDVAGMCYW